ncbi:MAG: YpdA family putative bacillithiol disulfide reductase [Ignavibacteriae bacterium]|nr:YpdA family putative bacillithiol disulfide reductase [Ignavibacteriota bacterium]
MIDVLVVGAGPAGLACTIEAKKADLSAYVLDKGSVVDAIRRFPTDVVWFSTPEQLEIGNVPFVIPTTRPKRVETIHYYQRVASHYEIDIRTFERVEEVLRKETHFVVTTNKTRHEARNVVVATGYYDNPNKLNIRGEDLPNVAHYYREPFEFFGKDVAVVGGSNSAVETALDLYRHGARVTLIHRNAELSKRVKYWILPDIENRIKNGEVKALFNSVICEIRPECIVVQTSDGVRELRNDHTFVLIGFHPDTSLLQRCGVGVNPETLGPVYDEQTFETNVPGLYVCGSIVAGKNNNKVFVENGRLHGAVIISSIKQKT